MYVSLIINQFIFISIPLAFTLFARIEVILNDVKEAPFCLHGPTTLFERFYFCNKSSGDNSGSHYESKRFYACSAYRDRKLCSFYCKEEDLNKHPQRSVSSHHLLLPYKTTYYKESLKSALRLCSVGKNVKYCEDCRLLIYETFHNNKYKAVTSEVIINQKHTDQHTTVNLTKETILQPSFALKPLSQDKGNAQFFFSASTCSVLLSILKQTQSNNVLCIGTPRLHGYIQREKVLSSCEVNSLLLDLDPRYKVFFPTTFCLFNMCNGHVFNSDEKKRLTSYLKVCDAVIVDPPFGALPVLVSSALRKLLESASSKFIKIFWIFPIFLTSLLQTCEPSLKPLHYRVNYDNHHVFKKRRNEDISLVRIFTNVPLKQISLADVDGYQFCRYCEIWVSQYNWHCRRCNTCTSVAGRRRYVHCSECNTCVKPHYMHCVAYLELFRKT
ncbi:rRNA N6-adenosine-methyltransferase ZCCHC4-like [Zophobas morio]|uniref:rRNA N6-adenosine-methyltransferase ZCCHC4-like n=1 Tax=Zophobas morio TaxID=2755281 RepID=UPI003083B367